MIFNLFAVSYFLFQGGRADKHSDPEKSSDPECPPKKAEKITSDKNISVNKRTSNTKQKMKKSNAKHKKSRQKKTLKHKKQSGWFNSSDCKESVTSSDSLGLTASLDSKQINDVCSTRNLKIELSLTDVKPKVDSIEKANREDTAGLGISTTNVKEENVDHYNEYVNQATENDISEVADVLKTEVGENANTVSLNMSIIKSVNCLLPKNPKLQVIHLHEKFLSLQVSCIKIKVDPCIQTSVL